MAEDLAGPKAGMIELAKELAAARQDVGVMLEKIRDLSHTLFPPILDTLGLVAAVKELAHQASRHSRIIVECSTRGKPRPLAKSIDVALYRCCQEALSNAIRHAQASKLVISIHYNGVDPVCAAPGINQDSLIPRELPFGSFQP